MSLDTGWETFLFESKGELDKTEGKKRKIKGSRVTNQKKKKKKEKKKWAQG